MQTVFWNIRICHAILWQSFLRGGLHGRYVGHFFLFPVSLLLLNVLHSNDEQSVHLRVGAGCVLIPLQRMPRQERVDEITKAERVHLGLRPRVSPDALANPLSDSRAEGAYPVPGNGGPIIAMLLQACAAKLHGDDSGLSVPPKRVFWCVWSEALKKQL